MRCFKLPSPKVTLEASMICKLKKEDFLSNNVNTEAFIKLLGMTLERGGHILYYCEGDADWKK